LEVNPEKQSINELFSTTAYHIDFYQREYKWKDDEVRRLIDDVFYQFEQSYEAHQDLDPTEENVAGYYAWYYLNTYITNKTNGKVFVVDGQQRLTTLTLILVVLHQMAGQDHINSPHLRDWLKTKIAGVGIGGKNRFWMAHEKREPLMQAILDGQEPSGVLTDDSITAKHMVSNLKLIQRELKARLSTQHKFDTFVYYFLCRVLIINLEVDQLHVPMVFEVINDRGVRLLPYEILKGKLLGEVDKAEVDRYADIWEKAITELEKRSDDETDLFFRTYLRAHHADNRNQGQSFDGPYHRAIFESPCNDALNLKRNPSAVKEFLSGPFRYYAGLFLKIRQYGDIENSHVPAVYYNTQLNRLDGHLMLAMAACAVNDPDEDAKIVAVASGFDKMYAMLQLNRAYDSGSFQELLFDLNPVLRGCPLAEIGPRIDKATLAEISRRRGTTVEAMLPYNQFRQVGYADLNTRFMRYFLTRIEAYIADGLGYSLQDSLYNYVSGGGASNAYHVEHILARNEESHSLFRGQDGSLDEATFEQERNRFGGLLLLKGRDNISSSNECYADKIRTYTGSAPYLAQTLVPDFYTKHAAFRDFIAQSKLPFEPVPQFTRNALENRSKLIHEIAKRIWQI